MIWLGTLAIGSLGVVVWLCLTKPQASCFHGYRRLPWTLDEPWGILTAVASAIFVCCAVLLCLVTL